MDNFLKDAMLGEIVNVISSVVESQAETDCRDSTLTSDDPIEALIRLCGRFGS